MESNEKGKSLVNVVPRNNNVLIRMEFNASILAVSSGKPSNEEDAHKVRFFIAGFGPLVKDITLNEEVILTLQQYKPINVKGNNNSLEALKEFYDSMKKSDLNALISSKDNKVNIIQYGVFPEYIVTGHIE